MQVKGSTASLTMLPTEPGGDGKDPGWRDVIGFDRPPTHAGSGITVGPCLPVLELADDQRHHGSPVLRVRRQVQLRLAGSARQRVPGTMLSQHAAGLEDVARFRAPPRVPDVGKMPRLTVSSPKRPTLVLSGLPVRIVKMFGRDQTALPARLGPVVGLELGQRLPAALLVLRARLIGWL